MGSFLGMWERCLKAVVGVVIERRYRSRVRYTW